MFPHAISTTLSISILVGSSFLAVSPTPRFPYALYPHDQTVPSAFNATVKSIPLLIFGFAMLPFLTILTTTVAVSPVSSFVTSIRALPYLTAVINPFSSTFAIFSFNDLYV